MFVINLHAASEWFEVLQTTEKSQTAVMSLAPGEASGEEAESHPLSDQVLLVLEGEIVAEVAEEQARMRRGDVVIIPAGVAHRFVNRSTEMARTFSVCSLPAYPRPRLGETSDEMAKIPIRKASRRAAIC